MLATLSPVELSLKYFPFLNLWKLGRIRVRRGLRFFNLALPTRGQRTRSHCQGVVRFNETALKNIYAAFTVINRVYYGYRVRVGRVDRWLRPFRLFRGFKKIKKLQRVSAKSSKKKSKKKSKGKKKIEKKKFNVWRRGYSLMVKLWSSKSPSAGSIPSTLAVVCFKFILLKHSL